MIPALAVLLCLAALVSRWHLSTLLESHFGWNAPDERTYKHYGWMIAAFGPVRGYRAAVAWCVQAKAFGTPTPNRWGWLLIAGAAMRLGGDKYRALAWLSLLAGALTVPLTGAVGWVVGGPWVGLAAGALALSSPLMVGLGRRALQDTPTAALTLVLLLAALLGPRHGWLGVGAFAAATYALVAVKDGAALGLPAAGVAWALAGGNPWLGALAIGAGFSASCATAVVLSGGRVHAHWQMFWGQNSQWQYKDSHDHGRGPWYRYPLELFALAPLVTACAIASWQLAPLVLVGWIAAYLGVFSLHYRNVRQVCTADLVLRVLAAMVLIQLGWLALGVIALVLWTEARTSSKLWFRARVYDPVPECVGWALELQPRRW